jgi:succinate dehydrogenase / fumarate reductase cytochrome b subunit
MGHILNMGNMSNQPKKRPVNRPKNLNLRTIRLPVPALVSILHRASGFFLYLLIPVVLWSLQAVLASEAKFNEVKQVLDSLWMKAIIFAALWAFWHHFCAGLRHLAMDFHWGMALKQARLSAKLVLGLGLLLTLISMALIC